jgi:hypothetical protein
MTPFVLRSIEIAEQQHYHSPHLCSPESHRAFKLQHYEPRHWRVVSETVGHSTTGLETRLNEHPGRHIVVLTPERLLQVASTFIEINCYYAFRSHALGPYKVRNVVISKIFLWPSFLLDIPSSSSIRCITSPTLISPTVSSSPAASSTSLPSWSVCSLSGYLQAEEGEEWAKVSFPGRAEGSYRAPM